MNNDRLYKYLDADGGLNMLYNSTLMFTNATQLNDPFDCHPALRDLSEAPSNIRRGVPGDVFSEWEYNKGLMRMDKTYICSLSKAHDSILMWSYYTKHSGVCIGLDKEKVREYTKKMRGLFLGCPELEVQYRDVINGLNTGNGTNDFLCYHFATKAKDWQHEQEVRLFAYDPSPEHMRLLPGQYKENDFCEKIKHFFHKKKNEDTTIPWKEVRAFFDIGGECFESVYLGVNLNEKKNAGTKEKIIKVARKCNPNIQIFQMTIDPKAFRLKAEQI